MPRFRRRMVAMRPINRIKHVVDSSATLTAASTLAVTLIQSTDTPVLANTPECETGSTVNGIYLRVEVGANETDAGAIPNFYMSIMKNPGGGLTNIVPNGVGSNDNKRYVIHQEMVMMNNLAGGNPRTVFNGVIAIPKGYRRNGPNDELRLLLFSTAVNVAVCVQCHYKEYR